MKMKRMATAALAVMMALTAVGGMTVYGASDTKTAKLNDAKIRFNGGAVQTIQCYNIDGFNFVKARDITNNLGMAVSAIQNGDTGIMVHPYLAPTSTKVSERLMQKTAEVKILEGNLIYDGWTSKAECFLLNGRYYFKLADFVTASETELDVALETVAFAAKGEFSKAPYMEKHYGITVDWNSDTKVIDVTRKETDLLKYFNDIRGGKVPVAKEEKETYEIEKDNEVFVEKKENSEATGVLTSAPTEGIVLANILIDVNEEAYLNNGKANLNNYTKPYQWLERVVGQCTWYARGRMYETYGKEFMLNNPFENANTVDGWITNAKSEKCPDLDGVTNKNEIKAGCIALFKGHALFVEWVDFNQKGKPETVYFTEANTQKDGKYHPDKDAKVKVLDFDDFIERQAFIGYVIVK